MEVTPGRTEIRSEDNVRWEGHERSGSQPDSLLAAIIGSSNDAIISEDVNGIILTWNRGAERIFGYSADEVIGDPISVLAVSEELNEMPEILARIRRGERIEHFDTLRRRKDGQVISVAISVSPVRDQAGDII